MKRRMVHHFAAALAMLALTLGAAGEAFAGPATDAVRAKQSALFNLLKQDAADSQKKIDALFDEMFDCAAISEASLGSEWAARSDAEKAQFSDLLKQLVRKSYEAKLKKLGNYDVQYVGEARGGAAVMVKTEAKSKTDPRAEPIENRFKMVQKGEGKWKVQDLQTEGVSLVSSYRSQFTKIIKKNGFPALIQKMKDKLAKGDV